METGFLLEINLKRPVENLHFLTPRLRFSKLAAGSAPVIAAFFSSKHSTVSQALTCSVSNNQHGNCENAQLEALEPVYTSLIYKQNIKTFTNVQSLLLLLFFLNYSPVLIFEIILNTLQTSDVDLVFISR